MINLGKFNVERSPRARRSAVYTEKSTRKALESNDCGVDPTRLTFEIKVERTGNDPSMRRIRSVEPNEVAPIQCRYCATIGCGDLQQDLICESLLCVAEIRQRHDIVAEST